MKEFKLMNMSAEDVELELEKIGFVHMPGDAPLSLTPLEVLAFSLQTDGVIPEWMEAGIDMLGPQIRDPAIEACDLNAFPIAVSRFDRDARETAPRGVDGMKEIVLVQSGVIQRVMQETQFGGVYDRGGREEKQDHRPQTESLQKEPDAAVQQIQIDQ